MALGPGSGEATIQLDVGSQFRHTWLSGHRVAMTPLSELIPAGATVDLLKIDIEGAEYEVLKSASAETLQRVHRIVLEFHPNAPQDEAIGPLTSNGFRMRRYQDDGEGNGLGWFDKEHV